MIDKYKPEDFDQVIDTVKKHPVGDVYNEFGGIPPLRVPGVRPEHYHKELDVYKFALENDLGFLEANVVKYVSRYKKKNGIEDLMKAAETLRRLIDHHKSKATQL